MRSIQHFRKHLTFWFENGAAGAALIQSLPVGGAGEILHIQQINTTTTAGATAAVSLKDPGGATIWNGTAKNSNTTTDHEFSNRRAAAPTDEIFCTLDKDPGASGMKVDVYITMYGREA